MKFSADQLMALDMLDRGDSVFLTGGAGSGKTEVIREFVRRNPNRAMVRLGTTGAASQLVGGQTLHSFFDLGRDIHRPGDTRMTTKMRSKIQAVKTIIVEEISMARIDIFEGIRDRLFGAAKGYGAFAGYQLVVVGDFAQLSPVATPAEIPALEALYGKDVLYAFQSRHWKGLKTVELTTIHRQAEDLEFAGWLGAMRRGEAVDLDYINTRVGRMGEGSTSLVATNQASERINAEQMSGLDGGHYRIEGDVTAVFSEQNMRVPRILRLKPGARVIVCANNFKAGYANGSTGTLIRCDRDKGAPIAHVRLDTGNEVIVRQAVWENVSYLPTPDGIQRMTNGSYKQLPLLPGWAITIHRAQGMTIDRLYLDTGGVFAPGQAYVGLSRATSLRGLTLRSPLLKKHILHDDRVRAFMAQTAEVSPMVNA